MIQIRSVQTKFRLEIVNLTVLKWCWLRVDVKKLPDWILSSEVWIKLSIINYAAWFDPITSTESSLHGQTYRWYETGYLCWLNGCKRINPSVWISLYLRNEKSKCRVEKNTKNMNWELFWPSQQLYMVK